MAVVSLALGIGANTAIFSIRDQNEVFSDFMGYDWAPMSVTAAGESIYLFGQLVSTAAKAKASIPKTASSPSDPVAFAVTFVALLLVAGLACFIPAGRAAGVDPIRVLRCE